MFKLKNDVFRRQRGGNAKFLDVYCANCDSYLFLYQKDGPGHLYRTYLNRIFHPPKLEGLQYAGFSSVKDISNLVCDSCSSVIGTPMKHIDGRFAYRLIEGSFYKKRADPNKESCKYRQ
jgi:ribosomal protein S27E